MRPLARVVPGALLSAGAFLACATPSSSSPTPVDAGQSDSGVQIDAVAPTDAAGGDAPDAPVDGPPEPPPPSNWCQGQLHAFCDDFDEDPLAQGWDAVDARYGSAALDGTSYTSPARSFLASTSPLAAGGSAVARLSKRTIELAREIRFSFDVHPDAIDPAAGSIAVATIQLVDMQGEVVETLNVLCSASDASLQDISTRLDGGGQQTTVRALSPTSLVGAWTRVAMVVELPFDGGVGAGTVTISLGSTVALDQAPLGPSSQPAIATLYLGIVAGGGPAPPSAVRFDDVLFDEAVK